MSLSSIPFFRLVLLLSSGIATALFLHQIPGAVISFLLAMLLALPLVALLLYRIVKFQTAANALHLCTHFVLGLLLVWFGRAEHSKSHFATQGISVKGRYLQLRIDEPLAQKANTWRSSATVLATLDSNGKATSATGKILVYWPQRLNAQKPDLLYGDVLLLPDLAVDMPEAAYPDGFDFKAVMRYRNVAHQVFLTPGSVRKMGNTANPVKSLAYRAREKIIAILHKQFTPEKAALMASLLIGFKDEVEQDDLQAFTKTGTMHILAVSGMHVGLIYAALLFLFTGSTRARRVRIWQGIAILGALWCYAILTGLSASVVRATVMFSVIETGRSFLRQEGNVFNSLFAAAYLQLLFAPLNLIDVGFQLSYLAVLGILYFYPPLNRLYSPPTLLLGRMWQLGLVSIAATLATLPVSLYFFKGFPVWFVPANIIMVPLSSILVFSGIFSVLFYAVPFVGTALAWASSMGIDLMMWPARYIAGLPGAMLKGFSFDLADVVILYSAIVALAVAIYSDKRRQVLRFGAGCLCLLSAYHTFRFFRAENSAELIVGELKGHLYAAYRQGRILHVFTEPVRPGEADSLHFYMKDYLVNNHIAQTQWHCGFPPNEPATPTWSFKPGETVFYQNKQPIARVLWLPEKELLNEKFKGITCLRYRHKRYAEGTANLIVLRNNYHRLRL